MPPHSDLPQRLRHLAFHWRQKGFPTDANDGADLSEEIRDEIADIRVYLELLAKCFGVEGAKLDSRVEAKLLKVVEKHRARLAQ